LGSHAILRGRDDSEQIKTVRSFTGQSLSVPTGAIALLKLSSTTREAQTPMDLDAEDGALRAGGSFGSHSAAATGRAQGIATNFGQGRLVVLGEAGMFSAQVARIPDGARQREFKFGMNVPGNDDRQFALNVIHWLSGLLK